jgi:hypothetical protein
VQTRLKERLRPLALLALPVLSPAAPLHAQELRVTYLANEGVLVESGGTRILIDALFRDSLDPYVRHSRVVQEELETGTGPPRILAYRLELVGRTVAHLGDADPSAENFAKLASAGPVDLALAPFWWLLDSEATSFLKRDWKPRSLAALHIGATDLDFRSALQAAWPGVWAPTTPLESRAF